MFQSHAGSIEAAPQFGRFRRRALFQSHAGSIEAHGGGLRLRDLPLPFQSHAGSIEARDFHRLIERDLAVSIPRWFD